MSITIKNVPSSLSQQAQELCDAVFKTPEFEELVKDYPNIDREHLEAIVEEFDYDLSRVERALSKDLNGIYEDWQGYVIDEVEKMLKGEMTSDAWDFVRTRFDYEKFGEEIEDDRLVVHHPREWLIAVFHLS